MDHIHKDIEEVVDGLFRRLREVPVEPPAFLGTRVFASLDERAKRPNLIALCGTLAGALGIAALVFVLTADPRFDAIVQQPFVVRIAPKSARVRDVARAEIEIPAGIVFQPAALSREKRITLPWRASDEKSTFSFVLRGEKEGRKKIVVRLRDAKNRVLEEHRLRIDLRGATGAQYAKWGAPGPRKDEVDPIASRQDIDAFDRAAQSRVH